MKGLNLLVEEHHLILRGLDLLTTASEKIIRNQNPPREFFDLATDFTRNFTNKFHHYKEEIVMFGLLAQKHEGAIDAEIERLRSQHSVLHDHMNQISELLDSYSNNVEPEVRKLHRCLCEYVDVLRHHINAENKIFYPLAAKTLTGEEMDTLCEEFEKYAAKEGGDPIAKYSEVVDRMESLI